MNIVAALLLGGSVGGLCSLAALKWNPVAGFVSLVFGLPGLWWTLGQWGFTDGEQIAMAVAGLAAFFGIGFLAEA